MVKTHIAWTEHSWNPIRARRSGKLGHYCEKVSPGCANCYASAMQRRFGTPEFVAGQNRGEFEVFINDRQFREPFGWKNPTMAFVCSMTDLFGEWVSDEMIDRVFAVMAACPRHTFQVLTKRAERLAEYMNGERQDGVSRAAQAMLGDKEAWLNRWPLRNVWLGVSVEDQKRADERIPHLLRTPAAIRFLSCEPLLEPINLRQTHRITARNETPLPRPIEGIDWIIVGGESGPKRRSVAVEAIESVAEQCARAAVPCFVKQDCGSNPGMQGRISDRVWAIKQFPDVNNSGVV